MVKGKVAERVRGGSWEELYRNTPEEDIPWEAGRPSPELVDLVDKGRVAAGRALDLGCGLGTNTIYLAGRGFHVWGLDISPSALRRARGKARAAGVEAHWIEGDARTLPLASASLDFIYDRGCLHHQNGPGVLEYAAEVARVLRPGGRYQLQAFTSRFKADDLVRLFRQDFRVLRSRTVRFQERSGDTKELHSMLLERR